MTKAEAKRLFYWVRVDPGTYRGINNHKHGRDSFLLWRCPILFMFG